MQPSTLRNTAPLKSLSPQHARTSKLPAASTVIRFDELERRLADTENRALLYRHEEFKQQLFERINRLLDDRSILSLDVFDTLVIRDNSSEITRFLEVSKKIAAELNKQQPSRELQAIDMFLARYLGTKASYRASPAVKGCREGSLTEIYRTAARLLEIDTDPKHLIDIEIGNEVERIEPNEALIEYAENHVAKGGRVLLLTDMYMHAEQVRKLLDALAIPTTITEHLISSADTKVSKASGIIFDVAETYFRSSSDEFVHLGDSINGDYKKAITHGWRALHLPVSKKDIQQRRQDHLSTAETIRSDYGITTSIAIPR